MIYEHLSLVDMFGATSVPTYRPNPGMRRPKQVGRLRAMRRRAVLLVLGLGLASQVACSDLNGPTPAPSFILDDPGGTTQPVTYNGQCQSGYYVVWVYETRLDGSQVPPYWFCTLPWW